MSGGLEHIKHFVPAWHRGGFPDPAPEFTALCSGNANSRGLSPRLNSSLLVWPPCSLIGRLTAFYHYDQQGL